MVSQSMLPMFLFAACVCVLSGGVAAERTRPAGQQTQQSQLAFLKTMDFNYQLRVCNAFADAEALDLYAGTQKLTSGAEGPMKYGSCRDLKQHTMRNDDRFDFKVGDSSVGTFLVSNLPANDAVLLLVVHRRDADSNAGAFESHVFSTNLPTGQIAVVDTYNGKDQATKGGLLQIRDVAATSASATSSAPHHPPRSEALRYNSVVAVRPGNYELALTSGDKTESKQPLVVLGGESYVIIRGGTGDKFPQALTVFPESDASMLGAARHSSTVGGITMLLVAVSCTISAFLQI